MIFVVRRPTTALKATLTISTHFQRGDSIIVDGDVYIHGWPPWGIKGIHGYNKFLNQCANLYTDLCAYNNCTGTADTAAPWPSY
jgi:hypothetical protein